MIQAEYNVTILQFLSLYGETCPFLDMWTNIPVRYSDVRLCLLIRKDSDSIKRLILHILKMIQHRKKRGDMFQTVLKTLQKVALQ